MFRITTASALRAAGLAVWLMVAFTHFAAVNWPAAGSPLAQVWSKLGREALIAALLTVFALCLWINMREGPAERTPRGHVARLLAQAAVGLVVHTDLMYVVAGQAALVLERRAALRWLLAQTLVLTVWGILIWNAGRFDVLPTMENAPPLAAFGVTMMALLTWQTFAFCAGWLAAGEARQRRAVARLNAELQMAQQALAEQSRLEERLHISRELHDSLGHHLVALNLQLDLAQRVPDAKRQEHVDAAAGLSRGMLGEVRRVVSALREEAPVDLQQALLAIQASVPEPQIHLNVALDLAALAPPLSRTLLRCVQEGVNNTLRHARAANLWIGLHERGGVVELSLRDDGTGCAAFEAGNGLTGMRERAQAHGGTFTASGEAGRGFQLTVTLPLAGTP